MTSPASGFIGSQEALTALDHMGHFVGLLTADGTLVEANATALRAGGVTRDDVVGRPFWEAHWWSYDEGVQDQLRAAVRRAADGETVRYDVAVRGADGGRSLIVIDFQLTPVREADGSIRFLVPEGSALALDPSRKDDRQLNSWAHLIAELDDVRGQADALRSLASALAGSRTVDEVAAAIADTVAPSIGAVFSNVAVVSDDGEQLRIVMPASMDEEMAQRWVTVQVDRTTPLGTAVIERAPVHCRDPHELAAVFPSGVADATALGLQALAAFPLTVHDGTVLAAVGVAWDRPAEAPDVAVTTPVLALCTAALRRAWATDNSARLAALLDTLLREAPVGFAFIDRELRFSHVNHLLAETNGRSVEDHVGRTIHEVVPDLAPQAEPVLRRVIDEGIPITGIEIVGETSAEPGTTRIWEESFYPVSAPEIGIIGAGVVVVEVTQQRREQAKLRRLVDHEREIARRLQAGLLPTEIPAIEGYEVSGRYTAGTAGLTVGGDWYEVLEIADGDVAIVVGDAVGHDLDAAIAMSQIRSALTGLSHTTGDPATVVERLDEWASSKPAVLASTLFYGRLDTASGLLRYTLAGHHPPLVVHLDGTHDWFDADPGPPVGVVAKRATNECPFRPGDILICYTDGLIEDRDEPIEAGRRRLVEIATELRGSASLDEFTDALLRRVPNPSAGDDIVLLNLRHNP